MPYNAAFGIKLGVRGQERHEPGQRAGAREDRQRRCILRPVDRRGSDSYAIDAVVGSQQRVDEEPRHVHVVGLDGGEVVHEGDAEVEVGAVRLVGQLAQPGVALALGHRPRVGRLRTRARRRLVLASRRNLGLELGAGALDRASSRDWERSTMIGRPRSNSISTPAARA